MCIIPGTVCNNLAVFTCTGACVSGSMGGACVGGKWNCLPVDDWVKKEGLTYLGVPKYIASGSHTHDSMQYRFMVMERYGNDLQKSFVERGRKFSVKTICYLALRLVSGREE